MSVLAGQEIRRRGIFKPFNERSKVNGMSYGLSMAGYDVRIAQSVILWPGDFRLASTIEHFDMPNDVLGIVHDKSTWARRGLSVFNTVIEPGWQGFLTMELRNQGYEELVIEAGSPIAQIVLQRLTEPAEQVYDGKYQNQPARPVEAILER